MRLDQEWVQRGGGKTDERHYLLPDAIDSGTQTERIRIYEDEVPPFVGDALEQLYASVYCTTTRISLYDSLSGASTYLSIDGGRVRTLILFRASCRGTVEVLNQQISLTDEQIRAFCSAVFARYPLVRNVHFYALDTTITPAGIGHPCQSVPQVEEFVVTLPESTDAFLRQMPYQTRARILKSIRRIQRDYPTYRFEIRVQGDIEPGHIREMVRMADERMKSKGLPSYIAVSEVESLARLARTYGLIGLIYIDGAVCGGTLCYRVGTRYFSRLITHDPHFDAYGLGNQLQLSILQHCIASGGTEVWMMGGATESKRRFVAQRRLLNSITVYRSRLDAWISIRRYASNQWKRTLFSCREHVRARSADTGMLGRAALHFIAAAKAARGMCRRARAFAAQSGSRA